MRSVGRSRSAFGSTRRIASRVAGRVRLRRLLPAGDEQFRSRGLFVLIALFVERPIRGETGGRPSTVIIDIVGPCHLIGTQPRRRRRAVGHDPPAGDLGRHAGEDTTVPAVDGQRQDHNESEERHELRAPQRREGQVFPPSADRVHELGSDGRGRRPPDPGRVTSTVTRRSLRLVEHCGARSRLENNSRTRPGWQSAFAIEDGPAMVKGGVALYPVRRRRLD